MYLKQLESIPNIKIDVKKIFDLQEKFRPILDKIDSSRQVLSKENIKGQLCCFVDSRMQKYKSRLVEEYKLKKSTDIELMFSGVVGDIVDCCEDLVSKKEISLEDLFILHKKLYPKGLWGHTTSADGKKKYLKLYPSGEYRKVKDFKKYDWGDYFYLDPEYLSDAMINTQNFLEKQEDLHFIIRLILYISYAGYIHPFYNGNGTFLRFYFAVLLIKNGYSLPSKINNFTSDPNLGNYLISSRDGSNYDDLVKSFLNSF